MIAVDLWGPGESVFGGHFAESLSGTSIDSRQSARPKGKRRRGPGSRQSPYPAPEHLQSVSTGVGIKAMMAYTERRKRCVQVTIRPEDVEPLLVSAMVSLDELEPGEDGSCKVVVEGGKMRETTAYKR